MLDTARAAAWVELAADLVSERSDRLQSSRINRLLAETFSAVGSAFCGRTADGSFVQELWPTERFAPRAADIYHWSERRAHVEHPILRYYLETDDWRVMQVADVPTAVVPASVTGKWLDLGRQWGGVHQQLTVPFSTTRHGRRAFVVGRPDVFSAAEMGIARQIRRLLAALDRHQIVFARWCNTADSGVHETAQHIGLTPRELAVLALLAEGLTAASIGRRLLITERTVHKHLQHSYMKLGVTDRLGAVLRAQHIGLLSTS
jgi:DNA-binding CsgD family transcriptional regulator